MQRRSSSDTVGLAPSMASPKTKIKTPKNRKQKRKQKPKKTETKEKRKRNANKNKNKNKMPFYKIGSQFILPTAPTTALLCHADDPERFAKAHAGHNHFQGRQAVHPQHR
jgi:hypothetical protein